MTLPFQFDDRRICHSHCCSHSSRYLTWSHSLAALLRACLLGAQAAPLLSLLPSIDTAVCDDEPHIPPPPPPYPPLSSVAECAQWHLASTRALSVNVNQFVPRVLSYCAAHDDVVRALAAMLCDERARNVAHLLRHDSALMRRFFTDPSAPQRVAAFFANFEWTGQHRLGSEPLARFLMLHRNRLWSRLQWLGNKRGVPPPVAAHKPQSFLQLDALHAVATLLRDDDEFWRFPPLVDAFNCTELVQLDPIFFVNVLVDALRRADERVLALARDLLQHADPGAVCARILVHLPPHELAQCLYGVTSSRAIAVGAPPSYVRGVQSFVLSDVRWPSYESMLLCWALVSRMRVLMTLASSERGGWRATLLAWSAARRAHLDRDTLCCGFWKVRDRVAAERDVDKRLLQTAGLLAIEGAALWLDMIACAVDAGDILLRNSTSGRWKPPSRSAADDRKRGRDGGDDDEWTLRDQDDKTFVFGANELIEQAVYEWQNRRMRV